MQVYKFTIVVVQTELAMGVLKIIFKFSFSSIFILKY